MAIKLKSLENISKTYTDQGYIYKDISLDIQLSKLKQPGVNVPVPGRDLEASFDLAAIRNSLQNLFNTLPGQRFLFPEYGTDLYQFLFSPITEGTANAIRNKIIRSIQDHEPRVSIRQVNIVPDESNNTYFVTIVIAIPVLKQTTTLTGELNIRSQTFTFVPTTRNL